MLDASLFEGVDGVGGAESSPPPAPEPLYSDWAGDPLAPLARALWREGRRLQAAGLVAQPDHPRMRRWLDAVARYETLAGPATPGTGAPDASETRQDARETLPECPDDV